MPHAEVLAPQHALEFFELPYGWIEYKWNHPITNEVKVKATDAQHVGDIVIARGAYEGVAPGLLLSPSVAD